MQLYVRRFYQKNLANNVLTVHVYSDPACHRDERIPGLSECLSGDGQYRSYELRCVR